MPKGFTLVFGALFLSVPVLVVAACSSDDTSQFNEGTPDAASDSPGTFNTDANASDSALGDGSISGAKCEPTIAATYTKQWTPPTQPSAPGPCQAGDLTSYFDDCLASLGQDGGASACNTWKAAHDACGKCLEPIDNSGPIQWYQSRYYYTLNVAGCIAIEQNAYGADDCGGAYGAAVNCERDACDGCFKTGTSTFNDFRNCENQAAGTGLCKSLETDQASKCVDVKTTDPTKTCFKDSAEDAKTFYARVMGIFCGP